MLAAGETYPLTLQGTPRIGDVTVRIEGNGATIEQTRSNHRVLTLSLGDLTLDDVTITGGDHFGGGAGIRSTNGTLALINSTVRGNRRTSSDLQGGGAGIQVIGGFARLVGSIVTGNVSESDGGGISLDGASVTIEDSEISGNEAAFSGGGIYKELGETRVIRSIVSDNSAVRGGGIFQDGGTLTAVNTTLSGNSGQLLDGGAVFKTGGEFALVNSTVTGNESVLVFIGGAAIVGSATLSNTIVADQEVGSDCGGSVTSLGNNLDSDGSCGLESPGDRPNANANLGPLADNGGPTRTHELLEGSDALDAGDDGVCAADPVNGVDQRGIERPQGPACDIGAFELEVEPIPTVLTAEPALLHVGGGLLGMRIRLLDLSARLVRADTGEPIQGETVAMTVAGQGGGNRELCSAVTDDDGVATCDGDLRSLLGLLLKGYTATFAGTWQYEPSNANAPLIRVDVGT